VPLHVVSRRLGHANEAFTARVYGHVLPQQAADAAARFAALVDDGGPDEAREDEED
jgi:integrase